MTQTEKIKILVVDDDADVLTILAQSFKFFGFNVMTAMSGDEAWKLLNENALDVVISDIRMNNGNGFELLNKIRARHPALPKVLFVSGYNDYTPEELFGAGADGIFAKPFESSSIRDTLQIATLSDEMKWRTHFPEAKITVTREFESLEKAISDGELSFGSGGFFIKASPTINADFINFDFHFLDGKHFEFLRGVGKVHWHRGSNKKTLPSGAGVEIKHLEDECVVEFSQWLAANQAVAYIPKS